MNELNDGKMEKDGCFIDKPQQEEKRPVAEVISLSQYIQDKEAGPWAVFEDSKTDAVNVAPMELIMNWACGEVEIDKPEHFEVIRAILYEWYNARMSGYDY